MSHAPTCSLWKQLPIHALLIGGIALLAAASPAHAGLGDMMKKATDKATKAATQKATPAAPCKAVEYDDVTLELTNDRVEHILAAFKAAGDAGAGRPALVEKLNKVNEERGALWDKHGETIQATRSKRDDIKTCYHDGYQAAQERRTEEYTKRAMTTDPALLAKYQRAAAENNAAAAKGDSAALSRIMQVMHEETAPTPEDSLKVKKECGPLPPQSAAEAKVDALDKETTSLNDQIARVDENVAKAQSKAGGMGDQQWAAALERIRAYLGWKQSNPSSKSPPCGFNGAEFQALEKHAEQLRAVVG
jgi:predicted  nucleic acid-binding Zn-ribbon protein